MTLQTSDVVNHRQAGKLLRKAPRKKFHEENRSAARTVRAALRHQWETRGVRVLLRPVVRVLLVPWLLLVRVPLLALLLAPRVLSLRVLAARLASLRAASLWPELRAVPWVVRALPWLLRDAAARPVVPRLELPWLALALALRAVLRPPLLLPVPPLLALRLLRSPALPALALPRRPPPRAGLAPRTRSTSWLMN
jgi:hypothetical protein